MEREEFEKSYPGLIMDIEKMTRAELIDELIYTITDWTVMEQRVQIFMNECTNMSKTNYKEETIYNLINDYKEETLKEFCRDLLESEHLVEEIKSYL